MVKVDNKNTLKTLATKFMKMNRARNMITVIAVMLTALLFTSLFIGSTSLILSKRAVDIKQTMSSSHASAEDLSREESKQIQKAIESNEKIERWGEGIFLGAGTDNRFGFSTEVRYGDINFAESFNCKPTTGRMPVEDDEIAVGTIVLDALGISHKLGEEITITYEQNPVTGEEKTDTFRLCGYWEGDKAVMSQLMWVSRSYAQKNRYQITAKELDGGLFNGGEASVVWFKNTWDLREKVLNLSEQSGLTGEVDGFRINPAYDLAEEDSVPYMSVGIMILFIILAGYLIIYNIFNISVKADIRAYGLLKNVGTTGKQLKKIVRMQAWRLSFIGIPIGLMLGWGAGVLMAPSLNANASISVQEAESAETIVSAHPLIFITAVILTLLTVYLSSLKACKMVERISPVEALKLAESDQSSRKVKKNTPVSWYGMAAQNMRRGWKKGIIVMFSIALSMVVVNAIVMLVQGYDFESYRKMLITFDFELDQMTGNLNTANFNGISPEVRTKLEDSQYTDKSGYVYYSDEKHIMEENLQNIWKDYEMEYSSEWSDYDKEYARDMNRTNEVNVQFVGISEAVFEKLEWKDKAYSWEDFVEGESVIVDYVSYGEKTKSYYKPGDDFHMEYQNKKSKTYEVLGEAIMPYSLSYPYYELFYITVMVPDTEYMQYVENDSAMYAAVDVVKGTDKQMKEYIENEILDEYTRLNVLSVLDMRASFQRYINKYFMIGGCLVVILLFIGLMNFYNTTAASVLSRRRELALLEAVGMTKRQITKMLVMEGFLYIGGAFILAVIIMCTCGEQLLASTLGKAFFFRLNFTIIPCICMLPLLSIIAYLIPKKLFVKMGRESVTCRLRIE